MFKLASLLYLLLSLRCLVGAGTVLRRWSDDKEFVTVKDTNFVLNGSSFFFYGSVSYWLNMLDDDELDAAFSNIKDAGIKVVRTWAFNDVSQKPATGTYFQVLADGKATINEGADGLQRLDRLVASAEKFGLKLILTLTNNWNPERPQPAAAVGRRNNGGGYPRGFLSNDYGGMDMYVRAFHPGGTHDLFYTDPTIVQAFKAYVSKVVPRFANSSTILAWELANDPRCASTLPASSQCNTQTITKWVADLAGYVKQLDPRHLVTAGDGGFYCLGCPKLFAPHRKAKRNYSPTGPAFDGSFGVDTEDITSIPAIDFGSFQLFPDQTKYYQDTPADPVIAKVGSGDAWVIQHSNTASLLRKPEVLTGFTVVTQGEWSSFVPFDASAPIPGGPPGGSGVTPSQHDFAIGSYVTTGYNGNVGGMVEFKTIPANIKIAKRVTDYPDISQLAAALLQSKT